jgi:hypothetical protein
MQLFVYLSGESMMRLGRRLSFGGGVDMPNFLSRDTDLASVKPAAASLLVTWTPKDTTLLYEHLSGVLPVFSSFPFLQRTPLSVPCSRQRSFNFLAFMKPSVLTNDPSKEVGRVDHDRSVTQWNCLRPLSRNILLIRLRIQIRA